MIFIDSNIPMYAAGSPSPQKEECLAFLEKVSQGEQKAASSAEVLQEILHRYNAIHRLQEGLQVYDLFRALPIFWLDISVQETDGTRELLEQYPRLSSRDALHIAVMRRNNIKKIVTYDKGFLGLSEITVFLPNQLISHSDSQ